MIVLNHHCIGASEGGGPMPVWMACAVNLAIKDIDSIMSIVGDDKETIFIFSNKQVR